MPVPTWQQNVQPPELVRSALSDSLAAFVARYADTGFLLVRIPVDGNELVTGLTAALSTNEKSAPVQPALSVMNFATAVHDPGRMRRDSDPSGKGQAYDEASVKGQLTAASCSGTPASRSFTGGSWSTTSTPSTSRTPAARTARASAV